MMSSAVTIRVRIHEKVCAGIIRWCVAPAGLDYRQDKVLYKKPTFAPLSLSHLFFYLSSFLFLSLGPLSPLH